MSDSRVFGVLFGAAVLVAALFAPWYAIDFSGAARETITQQTGQLPGVLGEFARGVLSVLPDRIVVNGWDAFERTDIVLLGCALGAGFAALLNRLDVSALAGGGAVVTILLAIFDKPGPGGDLISLQWGAWLALAAAVAIVVAGRLGAAQRSASPVPAAAPTAAPAPAAPAAPSAPVSSVWPPV